MISDQTKLLIMRALVEDIGNGDVTTDATVHTDAVATAVIACKKPIVVSGLEIAKRVFKALDPTLKWTSKKKNGDRCKGETTLAQVQGSASSLLTAERTALNFLQHLSGIATLTSKFVEAVEGTDVKVTDTRKTIPGLRELEKQAVMDGGGTNHRMGLYDRYLIKDNHIAMAGGVANAIQRTLEHRKEYKLIEVEVRTKQELEEALTKEIDIVMLDNWPLDEIDEAIKLIDHRARIELSGGITLDNVKDYAKKGVDFISVGALTHSAVAVDINMTVAASSKQRRSV
jgi:nicotinate-nucleotide pyrophosphorylase (carboxylating)